MTSFLATKPVGVPKWLFCNVGNGYTDNLGTPPKIYVKCSLSGISSNIFFKAGSASLVFTQQKMSILKTDYNEIEGTAFFFTFFNTYLIFVRF